MKIRSQRRGSVYEEKKPICTIGLLMINGIVFLWLSLYGMTEDANFMLAHGAMYAPLIQEGQEYYRLFTSLFLHFGFAHLMNNMVMLFVMGSALEREIGKIKFLLIYFCAGFGGNVLSLWRNLTTGEFVVSAGASGAIYGIVGALLYIVIRNKGHLGTLTGRGMIFLIALSLYFGFTSTGVDNFAHVGGLVSGFLCAILLYWKKHGKRRTYT